MRSVRYQLIAAAAFAVLTVLSTGAVAAEDPAAQWQDLNRQIVAAYQHGAFNEAVPLAEQSLALARRAFGDRDDHTLTSMNDLAELYQAQGRYGEAEPLLRETLQIRRKTLGPKHPDTLASMNNLAALYHAQGRYGEAEPLLREALQVRRKTLGPKHPDTLRSMNNLGGLYDAQGRYGEAEPLLREALQSYRETLGPKHPNTLTSMNNLAEIYKAQGRYGEAEPLLREVLQGYRETLGPKHPDTLTSMNNLAGLYKAQGRYGEAEPLLREALQIRCETLGPKHPDTLGSMNNLAELYQSQGRTGDAEPLYREVLQISRETLGPAHPHTLGTQTNLVVLLAAEGRIPAAAALQAQMEPQVLGWLGSELYSTESVSVRRGLVASQATYQDLALSLALAPGADPAAAELAASALLRFKNLLADEDAYLAHLSRTSADPNIRAAAEHVRALHAARARLFQDEASAAQVEQVAQTARELDAAELELGRLSRTYSPSLQVRNVNVADLKAALASQPRRSVLLELRLFAPLDFRTGNGGAPHWAGVLVGGDGTVRVRDLGAVDDSLPAVQTTLAHPLDEAGGAAQAELHRRLIAPFAADLAGVERLYVAPDGALDLISFGLLRDASGAAMEAGMDVRLLLSGRDLLIQPPPQTAKGLVAVGGIDFGPPPAAAGAASGAAPKGDAPPVPPIKTAERDGAAASPGLERLRAAAADSLRSGFAALPHSGEEVAAIAGQYRIARRNEPVAVVPGDGGAQPGRSWLLALPPPRVLHLATHGFFWPDKVAADRPMLLAGIALAGANRSLRAGGEDGILFALEAEDLNLEGTELVVLSACDTATGRYDYGDGVAGLVRALRTAGARYVMVALRPVGDQSAAAFMGRFYHHWLNADTDDPAAALRAAQQEHLSQPPAPADDAWASFIIVGG